MILPQTSLGTLFVLIVGMLCLGLWANTYKAAGKLRFEVYYLGFAFGLGIAGILIAFTVGNMGFDGFSIMDDLMQSHKRQWMDAVGAGVVFTLANMFLVGAISVSGLAVAMPVSLGVALVVGALTGQLGQRPSNPAFLYIGCVVMAAGLVADALAQKSLVATRKAALVKGPKSPRVPGTAKVLILSLVSGLLMAGVAPLVRLARFTPDVVLGPYAVFLLFCVGAGVSTLICSLFFMNLPVHGEPLEIMDYFKVKLKQHLYGVIGGAVWAAGTAAVMVSTGVDPGAQVGRAMSLALANGGVLVAALCGIVVWKEFADTGRAKTMAFAGLALFAAGLIVLALAFN